MPNALDLATIQALLASEKSKDARMGINLVCGECGNGLHSGYCTNNDCPIDSPIDTYDCEVCGHCPNPGHCVASIECPQCNIASGSQCKDERGGLTGYHELRWQGVKLLHGVYYR